MKRIKHAFISILCIPLLMTGCWNAGENQESTTGAESFLLSEFEEDWYGDSAKEKLVLYSQEKEGRPIYWTIRLNEDEVAKLGPEDGAFSVASMKLEDLDGDQKPEVLFYRYSTGTAGAQDLNVFQVTEKKLTNIFSVANLFENMEENYQMEYIGNYQVSFVNYKTGLKATIPVYRETHYPEEEELLQRISAWVDPIFQYDFPDSNKDGVKEIVTRQRVIGVSHPDTIGFQKTTFILVDGQYKASEQVLYDSRENLLAKISLID